MRRWLPVALSCLCAASAIAQAPAKPKKQDAHRAAERTFRGSCSEATSRDLFKSCDADGDDRLDVFEASEAFDNLRGPRDSEGFQRLDTDHDGYVSWPEFDAALRAALQRGATFRVRTVRPFAPPTPEARPATPLQRFLQLMDSNQNGALDPAEIDAYLRKNGLPPAVASQLRSLDLDHNGRLEEAELAPWFAQLPGFAPLVGPITAAPELPAPWGAADKDHSGTIDASELAAMLRRLDPELAVWAAELLVPLDRNRDGVLQAAELPGYKPTGDKSTAAADALLLPPRLPLR